MHLTDIASHFWSLCVEMQFYVGIALVVALLGRRGLYLLPVICIAVTLHRVTMGAYVNIVTWRRVDEILAGGVLALIYAGKFGDRPQQLVAGLNAYVMLALLAVASYPESGFANYFRPYIAAAVVGTTLYNPPPRLLAVLHSRALNYVATISFALYVIHHLFMFTWLLEGERWVRYLKRPLLFLLTFALAHASTFYFEHWWIAQGKRLAEKFRPRKATGVGP